MKKFKVTYNYFLDTQCRKKRIGVRLLEAYDRDHAIIKMNLHPNLILKVETYENN